ncbi:MAG TPA: hypothetical protein VHU19_09565 [Pyrinomonadaceae bacterium]|jgi:hypothetical protein|nr:hypothetical protein [Pyrinomonadaceae bacterium]
MLELQQHSQPRRRVVACAALAALALLSLALCAQQQAARAAQSGRHAPKLDATPTPAATPQAESESESRPHGAASKSADVIVSFIVIEYDNAIMDVDFRAREDVADTFMHRLEQSRAVSASSQGNGTRKEARDRAKAQRDAYVVLFELDEETGASNAGIGQVDTRTLAIKTYVYAPKTGDLKFSDTIYQRPYRETATVGGIPVPIAVPTRRVEQYPSQLQLEQAARDAADRLMSRFNVILPPDN